MTLRGRGFLCDLLLTPQVVRYRCENQGSEKGKTQSFLLTQEVKTAH